jgi:hypothetical protein
LGAATERRAHAFAALLGDAGCADAVVLPRAGGCGPALVVASR